MKKALLIALISIVGIGGNAQTAAEKARQKKAEQTDLDNVKHLYTRLKEYKIDVKTELIWQYTYEDSTEVQLKKLAEAFEKENLKNEGVVPSKRSNKIFALTVTEIKKYSKPEDMNERVKYLNEIAKGYPITSPYAIIAAEKQKKEGEIGSYKKVKN